MLLNQATVWPRSKSFRVRLVQKVGVTAQVVGLGLPGDGGHGLGAGGLKHFGLGAGGIIAGRFQEVVDPLADVGCGLVQLRCLLGVESGGVARPPSGRLVLDGAGAELLVQAVDGGLVYLVHLAEIHPFEDVLDLLDVAVDVVPGGESLRGKVRGLVAFDVDEADAVADRVGHEVDVVLGVVAGDVEHRLVLVLQGLEDVFEVDVPDRFLVVWSFMIAPCAGRWS